MISAAWPNQLKRTPTGGVGLGVFANAARRYGPFNSGVDMASIVKEGELVSASSSIVKTNKPDRRADGLIC